MGYNGPVYMTSPTRDIAALLALDFIGVAYKQAAKPLFDSKDIKEMVKHSICLSYNEVTDVTPEAVTPTVVVSPATSRSEPK